MSQVSSAREWRIYWSYLKLLRLICCATRECEVMPNLFNSHALQHLLGVYFCSQQCAGTKKKIKYQFGEGLEELVSVQFWFNQIKQQNKFANRFESLEPVLRKPIQ